MQNLAGQMIMIVEDDYFMAMELSEHFRRARARVLGPFPTVSSASHYAGEADMAVLDLNLGDQKVYPLADELMDAAIPFVFYTAEDLIGIPRRFAHVARLPKPRPARETVLMLNHRLNEVTITSLLPRLRLSARLILKDTHAADRLIEATLRLALREQQEMKLLPPVEEWLQSLLDRALEDHGRDLLN